MARIKCAVCGLYRGRKPHTSSIHDRIRAARSKLRRHRPRRHSRG